MHPSVGQGVIPFSSCVQSYVGGGVSLRVNYAGRLIC